MKVLILSDIHLEFPENRRFFDPAENSKKGFRWPGEDEYDAVVLAGDIHTGLNGVCWARDFFPKNKPVIYVPGNHEFYVNTPMTVVNTAFLAYNKDNVHILNPGTVTLDGVTFIGATLWSIAMLNGYPDTRELIGRAISDFRFQYDHIERFSVARMQKINQKEVDFLTENLNTSEGKKVVITHFLPSQQCCAPQYRNDPVTPYFINDLDDLVSLADMWISGHTHSRMKIRHNETGTPIYVHPFGYPSENKDPYKPLIVEI